MIAHMQKGVLAPMGLLGGSRDLVSNMYDIQG